MSSYFLFRNIIFFQKSTDPEKLDAIADDKPNVPAKVDYIHIIFDTWIGNNFPHN